MQQSRLRSLLRPALGVGALAATAGAVSIAAGAGGSSQLQPAGAIANLPAGVRQAPNPPEAQNHDVSPPLREIPPAPKPNGRNDHRERPVPGPGPGDAPDPVVQSRRGSLRAPTAGTSFNGLGAGFTGPQGTQSVDAVPPDDNGAVGPNNYVQVVNESFAVFSKSGTVLYGPAPTNTIWSGFGGGCQANDDGDATVVYDRLADRWVISQFSVTTTPYLMCVAVSKTPDPTGQYYRYSFQYANFPDYPKLGVWPDGYYVTLNLFSGTTDAYLGPEVCAYDRLKMLAGQPATQKCFTLNTNYGSLLPSDLDGSTPPPSGAPNYLVEVGTGALHMWKFHADWSNPSNATLTGPTTIPVASFSPACGSSDTCIPQSGTSQKLDALGDRLMYRLAYRNFGDHESLVTTHSVVAGTSVGMRWYELRDPSGTPTVYQQGTYAPDSTYRWMGSVAMDGSGDIGLGYSVSSSSMNPGIRYTGRLAGAPLGQMTQGEGTLQTGSGSQTSYSRWGDYTSLSVDPSDDCTFWYTNQYLSANGSFNWKTRIGSFRLAGCGAPVGDDFSVGANPATLSIAKGSSGSSVIGTAPTSGSAQSVAFSASGQPSGMTVTFSPASVTAGGSSTMTVNVGSSTTVGAYPITVTATGATATHTTTVTVTVTAPATGFPPNGNFESGSLVNWSASGAATPQIVSSAHGGSFAAMLGSPGAFSGDSVLARTVKLPSGKPKLTFWYQPNCDDTIAYDQIQMQIRNTGGSKLATVLNVCSNTGVWTSVSYSLSKWAGKTVVLWFNVHDDGYPSDPTYALLDDVAIG
jgi:hypothetical protein